MSGFFFLSCFLVILGQIFYLSTNLLAFSLLSSLVLSECLVNSACQFGFWVFLREYPILAFGDFGLFVLIFLFVSYFYLFVLLTVVLLWDFSQWWHCLVFPFLLPECCLLHSEHSFVLCLSFTLALFNSSFSLDLLTYPEDGSLESLP